MLINFLVLSSEQLDYPIFRFEKSRVREKTKQLLANMKESLFLVRKKYLALWALREIQIDARGVHNGYRMGTVTSNKLIKSDETKVYFGEFPADLCAGKHLIFFTETLLSISMWVTQKLRYCVPLIQNNDWKTVAFANLNQHIELFLSNLDYKKLLSNSIQSISIELRPETGQLVPRLRQDNYFNFTIQTIFWLAWIPIMPIK